MTERGLPIVDGAPACPFVAFEDDRDERATSPDHRHRCYAEGRPAPRALAHQEAYCLSSSFPVCPTFQDWARREAARSRVDPPRPSDSSAAEAAAAADIAQRNPPRNWAAPPPWLSRGGRDPDGEPSDEEMRAALPRRGRGLSGSYADRVAADPAEELPGGMDDDFEDPRAAGPSAAAGAPPLAAAGAVAPRGAPTPPLPPASPNRAPEIWDEGSAVGSPEPQRPRRERDPGRVAAFTGGGGGQAQGPAPERRPDRRREDAGAAPEWERAKPMEAYPTLRSRRLPDLSIPPILVAVIALALAAAFVFALPGLLGFGNPQSAASPGATTPIRTSVPSFGPTPVPQATPQIYVVQPGDTLSRIAGRFGITLAELIAANAQNLPDPDKLQIGDQIIIPVPVPSQLPGESSG